MFARRERMLLLFLCAAIAISAMAIVFSLGAERLKGARVLVSQYTLRISKLQQSPRSESEMNVRDRLKGELEVRKKRFYRPGEMNPFAFGTLIRKMLVSHRMSVVRYQVIDLKGTNSVEFSVSGPITSLVSFLKEASEAEKDWRIFSLSVTMREGTGTTDAVFRIGYRISDL